MRVGALIPDSIAARRLRLALSAPWLTERPTLVLYADWHSIVSDGLAWGYDVCVVDPELGGSESRGCGYLPELERLRQALLGRQGSMVLYCGRKIDRARFLRETGTLGFPFLLIRDIDDDPRSILRVLARSRIRRQVEGAVRFKEGRLLPEVSPIVLEAVSGWPPAMSVTELARRVPTSESSLRRNCRKWGVPSPRELLRWSRVLEAVALASLGIRRWSRIAPLLGLEHPGSLSRTVRGNLPWSESMLLGALTLKEATEVFLGRVRMQ
jgi:AraC-like DNA-binding protein